MNLAMSIEPQRICLGVPHSMQTIGVPRTLGVPRYMSNLATVVPRAGVGVSFMFCEHSLFFWEEGKCDASGTPLRLSPTLSARRTPLSFMPRHVRRCTPLITPSNLAREYYSHSPSPLLRVSTCMPRHQPEPYIRRCVANVPLPRHTLLSFFFFLLFSFLFLFMYLVPRTSCALSFH